MSKSCKVLIFFKRHLFFIIFNKKNIFIARIYSLHKHNLNPNQTWHQLTLKFICKDLETKKEVPQFNVFERREVDSASADWRLCHIE